MSHTQRETLPEKVAMLRALPAGLLLLALNALDYTNFSFLAGLLEIAVLTAVAGILLGAFLDYLALRKTELI